MSGLLYRRLDSDGDMLFGLGAAGFLTGREAVRQAIITRIKAYPGEPEEDGAFGAVTEILGLPRTEENRELMELALIERVAGAPGALSVEDAACGYRAGRSCFFSCIVNTEYGPVGIETEI